VSRFTRDLARTLLAQGPVLAFGLATSVLLARALGPDARGAWALCFLIAQSAVFAAELGLAQALVYHVGRGGLAPGRALGALLPLLALLCAAVFAALRLLEAPLLALFAGLEPGALRLAGLLATLLLANSVLTEHFRALDRLDLFNVCRGLEPAARLAALALVFALGAGLETALAAAVAAEAAVLPAQLALALRLGRPLWRGAARVARQLVAYGARVQGAVVLGHVDQRLTGFVVAYFAAAADLAFYAIAEGLVLALLAVPTLVGNVLHPKIARQGEVEAARLTAAACRSTLFVALATCLAIAAAVRPLVRLLYGAEYLPSAAVVLALLPVAVARSGLRILSRYVLVANRVRILAVASAATLAIHAALLLALVPTWGVLGAALATSASHAVQLALVAAAFRRLSGVPLRDLLLVGRTDLARLARLAGEAASLRALRAAGGERRP
jgi:O-antigen/teichoic acid export membrane protein